MKGQSRGVKRTSMKQNLNISFVKMPAAKLSLFKVNAMLDDVSDWEYIDNAGD